MQASDFTDQPKIQLIEAILEYLEGNMTLRSILSLAVAANNNDPLKDPKFAEVLSQLNTMNNEITAGKSFSDEKIKETFTIMLEKLTSS